MPPSHYSLAREEKALRHIKYVVEHGKGATTVHEVECEVVFTYSWELHPGEKRYRILSKSFLDQNNQYQIWHSWAVYDSEALAINATAGNIRRGMEKAERKGHGKFSEEDLVKAVAAIIVKKLENIDA